MNSKIFPIVLGKIRTSPIIEETSYACLNFLGLKSPSGAIIWKSGSGKTFSLASLVFSTFANSTVRRTNQKITVLDPHNSSIPRIKDLVGRFYATKPDRTRISSVLTYSHPSDLHFGYEPKYGSVSKPLVFNPLVPFSNGKGWYVPAELRIEWLISSLRSIYAVSDFGPRNLLAIGTVAKMFLAFNVAIIEGKLSRNSFYTLSDLARFFLTLTNSRAFPGYVSTDLSLVDPRISQELRPSLKKMLQNVKTDKSYLDSANTKLWTFLLSSTAPVFGVGIGPDGMGKLFDMSAAFLSPQKETSLEMIDLSGFGEEKTFLASCVINAAYFFWKKRPISSSSEHLLVVDEFQSLIGLRTDTLYFVVQRLLFETRKFKIGVLPVFQELTENVRTLFSNFGFVLVFSVRRDAAEKVIDDLNAWISWNFRLLPRHVSNLEQGRFIGRYDTKKKGILTVVSKSLNFWNPAEIKNLLTLLKYS